MSLFKSRNSSTIKWIWICRHAAADCHIAVTIKSTPWFYRFLTTLEFPPDINKKSNFYCCSCSEFVSSEYAQNTCYFRVSQTSLLKLIFINLLKHPRHARYRGFAPPGHVLAVTHLNPKFNPPTTCLVKLFLINWWQPLTTQKLHKSNKEK